MSVSYRAITPHGADARPQLQHRAAGASAMLIKVTTICSNQGFSAADTDTGPATVLA